MEVLVDLRKLDLADRLGVDMISVEKLISRFEETLDEVDKLKERLEEYTEDYDIDPYDKWKDRLMENDRE